MGECSVSSSSLSWYAAMGLKLQSEVPSQESAVLKDANFSHNANNNLMAMKDSKSVRGDFDLNLDEKSNDSVKEALRKKLLNQEEIFRKQVVELHHVYLVQKNLMKDFGREELDGYNLVLASTQPVLGPFINHMKNQSVTTEKAFFTLPELVRTQPINHCLEEHGKHGDSSSGLNERFLDLELPATQCIHDTEKDVLNKRHGWDASESLAEMKHYSHCETEYSWSGLNLSLSIGRDNWKNRGGQRTCSEKNIHFSSQCIIDLEESTETISREDVRATAFFSATPACFGEKQESPESIRSSCSFANSMNKRKANGNTNCLESNASSQGIKRFHGDLVCKDAKDNMLNCHDWEELDLNRDLVDESYSHSSDVSMVSPPRGNSTGQRLFGVLQEDMFPSAICWKKVDVNCCNQTSILFQQDTVTSTLVGSDCKSDGKIIGGSIMCPIDLESTSVVPPDRHGDPDSHNGNSQHINKSVPLNGNNKDVAVPEISTEKVKEDIVLSDLHQREDTGSNGSLASCKSNHIPENCSSTETIQSGTDLEKSNVSLQDTLLNSEPSGVEKSSPQQEPESCAVREVNSETCREREEEFAQLDVMVQKGAVSLVYFLLDSSSRDQDGLSKLEETDQVGNMKKDQPQYSSDSYESMVLKLPECSVDDYCVSSKLYEVDDTSKKDSGIKLRRGRRLKDFQKDILPQLASLSSNEICEDVKIMEGVLRSREYKRLRSKMNNAASWSAPVRSRRSKPNYVSRRYYS